MANNFSSKRSDTQARPGSTSAAPSFNANTQAARLGFALRDKSVTEATAIPHVIPKLGMSVQKYMGQEATPMVGLTDDDRRSATLWDSTSLELATVPGAIVLDFQHLIALRDSITDAETNDIFINKWEEMRILNNMTKNWQPQDLQYLWVGLMEIKAHVANIRRILNIMRKVVNHELNMYYAGEELVTMLGFPMGEQTMRQNWVNWWSFFNVSILGNLNNIKWLTGMVPGENRWAGMYTEIYKDVAPYTDYTQLYILRPACINFMKAEYNPTVGYAWTFEQRDYGVRAGEPGNGAAKFDEYLNQIHLLIRSVFYDDSAADIIATINAITERGMGSQVKAEYLSFPQLPLEGEDVKLTYDLDMLIAIHNATILQGAKVEAPVQDPKSGTLSQRVLLNSTAMKAANYAKPINLPNFGATTADLITATQWTVCSPALRLDPTSTEPMELRANAAGSEICVGAYIWYYNWNQVAGSSTLSALAFNCIRQYSRGGSDAYTIDDMRGLYKLLSLWSNFAYAPLMVVIDTVISGNPEISASSPLAQLILGQTEVLYSASYRSLADTHRQFLRNFWGYPVNITENSEFTTSYSGARKQSSTGSASEATSNATAADSSTAFSSLGKQ